MRLPCCAPWLSMLPCPEHSRPSTSNSLMFLVLNHPSIPAESSCILKSSSARPRTQQSLFCCTTWSKRLPRRPTSEGSAPPATLVTCPAGSATFRTQARTLRAVAKKRRER